MSCENKAGPSAGLKRSKLDIKGLLTEAQLEMKANKSLNKDEFSEIDESDFQIDEIDDTDSEAVEESIDSFVSSSSMPKCVYDYKSSNNLKKFKFSKNQGLLVRLIGDKPIDFFELLFDREFMKLIVKETNKNAVTVLPMCTFEQSRIRAKICNLFYDKMFQSFLTFLLS